MAKLLPQEEWRWIQQRVPIACIDVLPLSQETSADPTDFAVGLILRETPHEGRRWCFIGGRLFRNEALVEAVSRELHAALGDRVRFALRAGVQPDYVAQYFTEPCADGGHDPRQHAIGLTFAVPISGIITPQGEAIEFRWFDESGLASAGELGFGQGRFVREILRRLASGRASANPRG